VQSTHVARSLVCRRHSENVTDHGWVVGRCRVWRWRTNSRSASGAPPGLRSPAPCIDIDRFHPPPPGIHQCPVIPLLRATGPTFAGVRLRRRHSVGSAVVAPSPYSTSTLRPVIPHHSSQFDWCTSRAQMSSDGSEPAPIGPASVGTADGADVPLRAIPAGPADPSKDSGASPGQREAVEDGSPGEEDDAGGSEGQTCTICA